jgi:hypothetical protein
MLISTLVRNAMVDAFVDKIDEGAGAGTLVIRTGAAPAATTDADSGTLLATLTFSDPAFGAAASGTATASAITSDTSIDATGTAGYARIKDSDGEVHANLSVGTSGADINFNSLSFVAGGTCAITSLTITQPAGSN